MSPSPIVVTGDITTLAVDVIVNAANSSLLGGGGVDGAIHRAAGPQLLEECATLDGCNTGQAKITNAYQLPCRYVIHTVGPVWHGGESQEAQYLASCYETSLTLAEQHKLASIAFPCISTGVFGYPMQKAAYIAVSQVLNYLEQNQSDLSVTFCCFDKPSFETYNNLLDAKL